MWNKYKNHQLIFLRQRSHCTHASEKGILKKNKTKYRIGWVFGLTQKDYPWNNKPWNFLSLRTVENYGSWNKPLAPFFFISDPQGSELLIYTIFHTILKKSDQWDVFFKIKWKYWLKFHCSLLGCTWIETIKKDTWNCLWTTLKQKKKHYSDVLLHLPSGIFPQKPTRNLYFQHVYWAQYQQERVLSSLQAYYTQKLSGLFLCLIIAKRPRWLQQAGHSEMAAASRMGRVVPFHLHLATTIGPVTELLNEAVAKWNQYLSSCFSFLLPFRRL